MTDAWTDLQLIGEGAEANEAILRDVFRVDVFKALDPLKASDFDVIVAQLGAKVAGVALPAQGAALKGALAALDVDWPNLSADAITKVIEAAKAPFLAAPDKMIPKLEQLFKVENEKLVKGVKKSTALKHKLNIEAAFSLLDERIVNQAATSQGHFVRDQFGKRSDLFSLKAQTIVAQQLEHGYGRAAIRDELHDKLSVFGRSRGYWSMIASVVSCRARAAAQVSSFSEAGIIAFLWESILDEATSVQCRFLHGRRFTVQRALQVFTAIDTAGDPEAIRTINPFLQHVKTPDGGEGIFMGTGASRKLVAQIDENAIGQKDKKGSFSKAMSDEALAKAGVVAPPAHGECRSTVIPSEESLSVPVPAPKPPPAPPPPPPPPPPRPAPTPAQNVMATMTGGPLPGDAGGFYTGADGVKRYVKVYDDASQAEGEHIANQIYRDLGLASPESVVFEHGGKLACANTLLEGKTLGSAGTSKEHSLEFLKGFVGDVLTGNWNAVGGDEDKALVLPSGKVARVDNRGTFLMRAAYGRKPAAALNAITEWEKFFDGSNPPYARIAARAGIGSAEEVPGLVDGIKKVVALRDRSGGWGSYVAKLAPRMPAADRGQIVSMLESRTSLLETKLVELTKPKPAAPKPGTARYVAKQYSTVKPKRGLKIEALPETAVIDDHYQKISRRSPDRMPSGEKYSSYRARVEASIKGISSAARSGISDFTGSGYGEIRESEEEGRPNRSSEAIQTAYKVATPEPGTVFRSIKNLPRAVIDKYLANEVFQLGRNGGATSSSSWNIDVSIDSFMGGRSDHGSTDAYKILFVLNGKTQIPVETISAVGEGERELLFKRDAKFRVTGLSRAKGTERVLIIEGEEFL